MKTLLPLAVFAAMGIVVIGVPIIFGLATFRDWALARFLRRHPRAIFITQAVAWIGFTACALLGTSEPRWLMVGIGVLTSFIAIFLAIRVPGEGYDSR